MRCWKKTLILLSFMPCLSLKAGIWETLPKGVRLAALKKVYSNGITNEFRQNGKTSDLGLKVNIDAEVLKDVEALDEFYFEQLRKLVPSTYDKFSAGSWELEAEAKVDVTGIGAGYGITDRLTAFVIGQWWKANVNISTRQTSENNYAQIASEIEESSGPLNGIQFNTEDLPVVTGNLVQNVITQYYGYRPVGNWEATGWGDTELGIKYRLTDWTYSGMALTVGTMIPTGREDDPDLIQDISFGRGYWRPYVELGAGFIYGKYLGLDSWIRATKGITYTTTLRVPDEEDFRISDQKDQFEINPGGEIDFSVAPTLRINDWISLIPEYLFHYQEATEYSSSYSLANQILSSGTEIESHIGRMTIELSSVTPYLKKKFPAPGALKIAAEKTMGGVNHPNYTLFSAEIRLMF